MARTVIVISSLLKSVTDARSYERLGFSLAKENKYAINIIGIDAKNIPSDSPILFYPLGPYTRRLSDRLYYAWQSFLKYVALRPQVIILTTVELIPAAILYKVFFSAKLVFDVQENYWLNIKHQGIYNGLQKQFLLFAVRVCQNFSRIFISHYLLAEACYAQELSFTKRRFTILENKMSPLGVPCKGSEEASTNLFQFLFSGTLAPYTGVLQAIDLFKKIAKDFGQTQLVIIGFSPDHTFREVLRNRVANEPLTIKLIDDEEPLDHQLILNEIRKSDLGILSYPVNLVNRHRIPTKLYEYGAHGLPFILSSKSLWAKIGSEVSLGIPIDFDQPSTSFIQERLNQFTKKQRENAQKTCSWIEEEISLLNIIDTLLKEK